MSRTVAAALLCAALLAALSLVAAQTNVALALANQLAVADLATSSLPDALQFLGAPPFPCSFKAPDGKYFDFSSMTTPSGTQVPGVSPSEVYMINVCGATSTSDNQSD